MTTIVLIRFHWLLHSLLIAVRIKPESEGCGILMCLGGTLKKSFNTIKCIRVNIFNFNGTFVNIKQYFGNSYKNLAIDGQCVCESYDDENYSG